MVTWHGCRMHYCTMHFLLSPWPVITLQRFSMDPQATSQSIARVLTKTEEKIWVSSNQDWLSEATDGLKIQRVQVEPACPPGENFVSKVDRITLHLKNSESQEIQKSVIIKEMLPVNSAENQIMDCKSMFENETTAYEQVLPLLFQTSPTPMRKKCQKRRMDTSCASKTAKNDQIGLEKIFPRCYFMKERLVLQDLGADGFKMANRKKGLTFEECQQALKTLAHFHSRSFLLKASNPRQWQRCRSKPRETVFSEKCTGAIIEVFWNNALWTAQKSLRSSEDPRLIEVAAKLSVFGGDVLATLRRLTMCEKDALAGICHGDLWSNNLLFKYDDDKRPMEARLLDLQAMRHTSVALDLLHLLCTSTQNLAENFHPLLQHYMDSLVRAVGHAPFRMDQLLEQIREKVVFGLLLGFMIIPCATSDPSEGSKKAGDGREDIRSSASSSKESDVGNKLDAASSLSAFSSECDSKSIVSSTKDAGGEKSSKETDRRTISKQTSTQKTSEGSEKSAQPRPGRSHKRRKTDKELDATSSKKTKSSSEQPQLTREYLDSDGYRDKCYQQLSAHCHLRIRRMVLDLLELNLLTDSTFV